MLRADEIISIIKYRRALGYSASAPMCDERRGCVAPPPRCSETKVISDINRSNVVSFTEKGVIDADYQRNR